MAGLLDEPYIGYPQLARRKAVPNTDVETSKGLLRGISYYPYDLLGAPIDLINMAITPLGMGSKTPVMGSDYLQGLAQKAGLSLPKTDSSSENIGRILSSIINPAAGARAVGKVIDPAMQAAAPVGRAMGEQAYRMTEGLLQRQGLMPSITAYHGTPYNIQGGFDISKIGTGEGAQAYGRGMYYAENPAVATEYQKRLSGKTTFGERPSDSAYVNAVESFREANYPLEQIPAEMKKAYKSITDKDIQLAIQATEKGNLYKVDIPDQYVPNMLDWDKPLNQQTKEVQEGLAKLGIKTDTKKLNEFDDALLNALKGDANNPLPKQPINPTGEDIYNKFIQGNPQLTSQKLNEVGIKGIRYLDEGSRNQAVQPYYQLIRKSDNSVYTQMQSLENAKEFVKDAKKQGVEFEISEPIDKRTSNFVVFDPTDVKILEKNSQKVEQVFEGSMPQYKDYENLASVFEKAGLKTQETGSSKSGSKYVNIYDPVSGENLTVRFADHPQTGSAISLHGPADIEIGEPFKNKSWKDAINPILDTINKSRREYGDELLTINQKVESLLD